MRVGVVDGGFGYGNAFWPNLAEVGAFGGMEAEETIRVLDGSLLAGGVGVGVVEVASDNGCDFGDAEKLAAIVGEETFHFDDMP